jgi:hypothetical protein
MLNNTLFAAAGASPVARPPHPFVIRVCDVLSTIQGYFQWDDRLTVVQALEHDALAYNLEFEEILLPFLTLSISRTGWPEGAGFELHYLPVSPTSIELHIWHGGHKTKFARDIAWTGTHWRPVSFSVFLDEQSHAEFVHSALRQAGLVTHAFRHLKSVG